MLLKRFFCVLGNYLPPPFNKYFYFMAGVKFNINKVWIGNQCYFDTVRPDLIKIEDDTCISFRVIIITHFDPSKSIKNYDIKNYYKPVTIKCKSFIGPGSILNPGVTVGENCFVRSGSNLFKSIPDNSIVSQSSIEKIKPLTKKSLDIINKLNK